MHITNENRPFMRKNKPIVLPVASLLVVMLHSQVVISQNQSGCSFDIKAALSQIDYYDFFSPDNNLDDIYAFVV